MQQEINLYLLLPAEKKMFLSLRRMMIIYGLLLGLVILHFFGELWSTHKEVAHIHQLQQELTQVKNNLAKIQEQYPILDTKDMENSLKKLQAEIEEKNQLLDLLAKNRNFSTYLLGVAKAAVPDLWLVDIEAALENKVLILKGYALQSQAIQQFMKQLASQKELADFHFQLQEVNKTELQKETLLNFIISTKVGSELTTSK